MRRNLAIVLRSVAFLLPLILFSCKDVIEDIPAEEYYARSFFKAFGLVDPEHDWSVLTHSYVDVNCAGSGDVKVYALTAEGKTQLLAHYRDVSGHARVEFDMPKGTEQLLVRSGISMFIVEPEGSVAVGDARLSARSIDGTDRRLAVDSLIGYEWDEKYVRAFDDVLKEQEMWNLVSDKIVADFAFVSDGEPFTLYPIYWNTGVADVLGVYWYENGNLMTQDIFCNHANVDLNNPTGRLTYCEEFSKYPHNMYRKAAESSLLFEISDLKIDGGVEEDGVTVYPVAGKITIVYNCPVKKNNSGSIKIVDEDGNATTLTDMTFSGQTVSANYDGLSMAKAYTVVVDNAFVPAARDWSGSCARSLTFLTSDPRPFITSVDIEDKTDLPLIGEFTVRFNKAVEATGAPIPTFSPALPETVPGTTRNSEVSVNVAADGLSATYSYNSLENDTDYSISFGGTEFKSKTEKAELRPAVIEAVKTADFTPKLLSTTFKTTNTQLSGTFDIVYSEPVTITQQERKNTKIYVKGDTAKVAVGKVELVGVSDDGLIATFSYGGLSYSTVYTLAIDRTHFKNREYWPSDVNRRVEVKPEGMVCDFTTRAESMTVTNPVVIDLVTGKKSNSGENVVAKATEITESGVGEEVTSVVKVTCFGDERSTKSITNKYDYTIVGTDVTHRFSTGIRTGTNSKDYTFETIEYYGKGGDAKNHGILYIESEADVLLTIYYNKTGTARMIDEDSDSLKSETSLEGHALTYRLNTGGKYYFSGVGGTDCDVCGMSYRAVGTPAVPDEGVETETDVTPTQSSRSRVGARLVSSLPSRRLPSRANTEPGTKNGGRTYASEDEVKENGFTRLTDKNFSSTLSGTTITDAEGYQYIEGRDNVVTHRISFTLSKGTIFGFYIRNNHGANNITNKDGNKITVPNTMYSTSELNRNLPNTLFNQLISDSKGDNDGPGVFKNGWGEHKDFTSKGIKVPDNRKFSTAATYTIDIDGEDYRYFSFEDWIDCDLNDIVFMVAPESKSTVVDLETDTKPYIFAVEDLGATTITDIDFNDVVFGVEHISEDDDHYLYVTMLAAGGTLPAKLFLGDVEINGVNNGQTIVDGPYKDKSNQLRHVNDWFGVGDTRTVINAGSSSYEYGYSNLTTVKVPVGAGFSLATLANDDSKWNSQGFHVEVQRADGTVREISRPDHMGETPQMIVLPETWRWPKEGVAIFDAYAGGITYEGELIPSFGNWVNNSKKVEWHKLGREGMIVTHPWEGSQAARDALKDGHHAAE